MESNLSDAFVFFGASGDLAHKKIFSALQHMVKQGALQVPVIGVARSGWTVEQLCDRARDGITKFGGGVDEASVQAALRTDAVHRWRLRRRQDLHGIARQTRQRAVAHSLPGNSSQHVSGGGEGTGAVGVREERPRGGGEAVRTRPAVGAQAQRHPAPGVSRGTHLPH